MKKKILPACMLLCVAAALNAEGQTTLNATGGSAYIGGNEFEWSVGEMALVNTFTTSSIIVTQGVLQTGLKAANGITSLNLKQNLSVFPNPVSESVYIHYTATADGAMQLVLSDLTGKVLKEQKLNVQQGLNKTYIDMSNLAAATYVLMVSTYQKDASESIVYKIQKLQ